MSGDLSSGGAPSGVTVRRKSVAVRTATQTLPRGFVMPSAADAEAANSGGGLGLRAAPAASTNPSITAAVQRAQAARTSTGGANDASVRSSSPSSPGGGRRMSTLAKPGDQLKLPATGDDSASPRKPTPRTSLTTATTPVTISSPPSSSAAATAKFNATKARLSISGRGGTMGRISFGKMDENSLGDDSPGPTGAGTRSRAMSSAVFQPAPSPQLNPAGRLSVGSKSMTPGHRSTASVSFAAQTSSADGSSAASNHHRNSSQMSAVLHPDSIALPSGVPTAAAGSYNAADFVSERALAAGAQSENITVVVRCRPFIREESARGADTSRKSVSLTSTSVSFSWKGEPKKYTYDQVFGDASTQRDVYLQAAGSLVHEFIKGFNATMFCYGQTGSGKTHTLFGRGAEGDEQNGIIPRACDHIFSYIASEGGAQGSPNDDDPDAPPALDTSPLGQVSFLLSVSFLEIYNEHVHDLLSFTGSSKVSLDVREDVATGSFQVPNLSKHIVTNRADLLRLIARGGENRSTTSTIMNEASSRSHSMLTITLEKSYRKPPPQRGPDDDDDFDQRDNAVVIQSKLNMVDLAGSERLTTNALEKTGKETMAINLSLSTLANVIAALTSEKPNQHVPYRDSKLTRLLKDSLGGNSKTVMYACINPLEVCLPETVSTLRYANRAKNIRNKPKVNQDPKDALLMALKAEITALKELLLGSSKMAFRMFTYVADLAVDDGENELKRDENGLEAKTIMPGTAAKALMPPTGTGAVPSSVTPASIVPPSPDGTLSQAVKAAIGSPAVTAAAAAAATAAPPKPAAPVVRRTASMDDDSPATSPDTSPDNSPKLAPAKEPNTPIPAVAVAAAPTTLSSAPSSPIEKDAAPTPMANAASAVVPAAEASPPADGSVDQSVVAAASSSTVSTADLESLPPEEFYSRFKGNVMKLYTLLLANQSDLSVVREQLDHAMARLRFHEGDRSLMADGSVPASDNLAPAVAGASVGGSASSGSTVAPPASGVLSPDFSPMSPTAVLNEATQRLNAAGTAGDQQSGLVSPRSVTAGSAAAPATNAAAAGSVAPSAAAAPGVAAPILSKLVPPPPPPRPPTLALAPASRRASLVRGSTVLYSPRNGSGDPSASPATSVGALTPADLSLESQRVLHLQASLEALRTQIELKDQKLVAARAESAKACADIESRLKHALAKAQDELLDRNRRLEDQETELEQHRINEREWRKIMQEHQAAAAAAGATGASASPRSLAGNASASPLSYDLSALSSPGYLAESVAIASPKSVSFAPADLSSSSSPTSASGAVASPPPSLDTFDGRLSYLRSVLQGANQTAVAFPKLVGLLQKSNAQLAEAEQKQKAAETELQRWREGGEPRVATTTAANGSSAHAAAIDPQPSTAPVSADAAVASPLPAASSLSPAFVAAPSASSSSAAIVALRAAHGAALSEWSAERAQLRQQLKSLQEQRQANMGTATAAASSAAAAGLDAAEKPVQDGDEAALAGSASSSLPPLTAAGTAQSPSAHWLEQTVRLQNSIVELSQEVEQLRNSKRELVKHSSQELKRMRVELMRAKGMGIPGEEPARVQTPAALAAALAIDPKDKSCVVQ